MADTFTPTAGMPETKKHFNLLWLIAIALLIAILIALGIIIFQNGAIKENTKPESQRQTEAYRNLQDQIKTGQERQAEFLKTDQGWFSNLHVGGPNGAIDPANFQQFASGFQQFIAPGHSIDEFEPQFIDLFLRGDIRYDRSKEKGYPFIQQMLEYHLEPVRFGFKTNNQDSFSFSTYRWKVTAIYEDASRKDLYFKVVIAHKGDKKYFYPIKRALF